MQRTAQKEVSNIFTVWNFLHFLPSGLLSCSPDMTRTCPHHSPDATNPYDDDNPHYSTPDRRSDHVKSSEFVLCQKYVDAPTRADSDVPTPSYGSVVKFK